MHISSSFIAPWINQSYELQQGWQLTLDVEHVIEVTQVRRFVGPNLIHILQVMRAAGGSNVDALLACVLAGKDFRLKDTRGWWECACKWRDVFLKMQTHT